MPQSIKGVRDALYAACSGTVYSGQVDSLGAPVLVSYGAPGTYQPNAIVAVAVDTRRPVTRPTHGTNRSRDNEAEIDIVYSVFAGGTEANSPVVADSLEDLVALLETYLRTGTNNTLGGACRDAFVSNIQGPTLLTAMDQSTGNITGRIAQATVTVTAFIRY